LLFQATEAEATKAKGGKQRRVHLDEETVKMLSEHISAQNLPDNRPIFALKQRQVRNVVNRYGATVRKDVHPHTFRHSFAILRVRNSWDIRRLQQVLGHSSLNVTAVYLHFNKSDMVPALQVASNLEAPGIHSNKRSRFASDLIDELRNYKARESSATGHVTYGALSSGHDDLVSALGYYVSYASKIFR
jgi:hypothetical protein